MQLRTWLRRKKMPQHVFATQVGCSQQEVCRWVGGQRRPSIYLVARIHRVTRGKVTLFDWVEEA